ncbi:MAG: hypothetical protein H7Y02_00905 [Candidatus Obscuribacterales bacterium]|nr:hypothetical protein [Steroidobacteraceae bacterium]
MAVVSEYALQLFQRRDVLSVREPPVSFSSEPHSQLHQLNREFLRLLTHEFPVAHEIRHEIRNGHSSELSADSPEIAALPAGTIISLRQLSSLALENIARCPYALFVLPTSRFASQRPALLEQSATRSARLQFAIAALLVAWHVARLSPTRAQLWFGFDANSLLRLREFQPHELSALALKQAGSIAPRWAGHPHFWTDLMRYARDDDSAGLLRTQLLGRQLLATEW